MKKIYNENERKQFLTDIDNCKSNNSLLEMVLCYVNVDSHISSLSEISREIIRNKELHAEIIVTSDYIYFVSSSNDQGNDGIVRFKDATHMYEILK